MPAYKTIVLELLKDRPTLHEQLRRSDTLMESMEQLAMALRSCHIGWMMQLSARMPGSDPSQLSSEALELAVSELQDDLPLESQASDAAPETLSLDAAMIYPVVCLGRIASHQQLEDGRSNLLLVGLRRAGVVRELPEARSFREAEVLVLDDLYPAQAAGRRPELQRRLIERFHHLMPNVQELHQQLDEVLANEVPLGMLTDILAFTLKLDLETKVQLLRETNVDRRAARLLEAMQSQADLDRTDAKFPPDFSPN